MRTGGDAEHDAERAALDVGALVRLGRSNLAAERVRGGSCDLLNPASQEDASASRFVARALSAAAPSSAASRLSAIASRSERGSRERDARLDGERHVKAGPVLCRGRLLVLDLGKLGQAVLEDLGGLEEDVAALDD